MTTAGQPPAGRHCCLAARAPSLKACRPDQHDDGPDWAVLLVVALHQLRAVLDETEGPPVEQPTPTTRSGDR